MQVFRGTLTACCSRLGRGKGDRSQNRKGHSVTHPERNHILLQWAGPALLPGTKYNPAARLTEERDAAELM